MKISEIKIFVVLILFVITSFVYYQGYVIAGSQYPIPSYIAYPLLSVFLLIIVLATASSKLDYLTKRLGCLKFVDKLVLNPMSLILITLLAQIFDLSTTYYGVISGNVIETNLHVRSLINTNNIITWVGEQLMPTFLVGAVALLFNSIKIRLFAITFLLTIFAIGLIAGISNSLVVLSIF